MSSYFIDDVDFRILQLLIEDSTISHKDIGQQVHMTYQAVGARIRKMQDTGVIEGYTVRWNPDKVGETIHAFITVFWVRIRFTQPFRHSQSSMIV